MGAIGRGVWDPGMCLELPEQEVGFQKAACLGGRVGTRRRLASGTFRGLWYTVSPLEWLYEKKAVSATLPVLLVLAKAVGMLHANMPAALSSLTHWTGVDYNQGVEGLRFLPSTLPRPCTAPCLPLEPV